MRAGVQTPLVNCSYSIFIHVQTDCKLLEQMVEKCCHSEGTLAISVSRDSHTVRAHYSRQQVIAYLLHSDISIETDWPFFLNACYKACFITSEEPFTGPTWTLLTFIRQADRQSCRNPELSAMRSCHEWFDSICVHLDSLSITYQILMQLRWFSASHIVSGFCSVPQLKSDLCWLSLGLDWNFLKCVCTENWI